MVCGADGRHVSLLQDALTLGKRGPPRTASLTFTRAPIPNRAFLGSASNGSNASNVSFAFRRMLFEEQNANDLPIDDDWLLAFRASCTVLITTKTIQTLKLLYVYRQFGEVLTALMSMIGVVQNVVVLYVVIMLGCSIGYGVLSVDREENDTTRAFGGYYIPFFSFMGVLEADVMKYTPVAIFHLFYTLVIDIAVLNLIIAIMTDMYFKAGRGEAAIEKLRRCE